MSEAQRWAQGMPRFSDSGTEWLMAPRIHGHRQRQGSGGTGRGCDQFGHGVQGLRCLWNMQVERDRRQPVFQVCDLEAESRQVVSHALAPRSQNSNLVLFPSISYCAHPPTLLSPVPYHLEWFWKPCAQHGLWCL